MIGPLPFNDANTSRFFGLLGAAVSVIAVVPYGLGIYRRTIRPHLFTWLIWSVVTIIASVGQFAAGAGPAAWCTSTVALTCLITFLVSLLRGDTKPRLVDWWFLAAALAAIPAWIVTRDPTVSVCLVTLVELAGFGPTICKTIHDPWGESLLYFILCVLKYGLAVLALQTWSLATAIYPVATIVPGIGLCLLIVVRRRLIPRPV